MEFKRDPGNAVTAVEWYNEADSSRRVTSEGQTKEDPRMDTVLELVVERHDRTSVVRAAGEIDIASAPRLRKVSVALVGQHRYRPARSVVSGLNRNRRLIREHNRLLDDGGDLRVREPQGIVRTAIEVLGLECWIDD